MADYPEPLFPEITNPKARAFLAAYAKTGRIVRASQAAQTSWKMHYIWLNTDSVYQEAFAVAQRMAGDFLEDEALRRAVEGWEKPVFYKGEHVDNERIYSDTLLIVALKGAKPEKYRENATLTVQGNVTLTVQDRTREANDRIMRLRRGLPAADNDSLAS